MPQLVTRIADALAADVDALVAAGVVRSRSEAVRVALRQLVDEHRRTQTAEAIRAGYQRVPQTEADVGWPDAATESMISEEPW